MKIIYAYNLYQKFGGENLWFDSEPQLFEENSHEVTRYIKNNKMINDFDLAATAHAVKIREEHQYNKP